MREVRVNQNGKNVGTQIKIVGWRKLNMFMELRETAELDYNSLLNCHSDRTHITSHHITNDVQGSFKDKYSQLLSSISTYHSLPFSEAFVQSSKWNQNFWALKCHRAVHPNSSIKVSQKPVGNVRGPTRLFLHGSAVQGIGWSLFFQHMHNSGFLG